MKLKLVLTAVFLIASCFANKEVEEDIIGYAFEMPKVPVVGKHKKTYTEGATVPDRDLKLINWYL